MLYHFFVMRALTIIDSEEMILVLQDEIRRSEQSRYDHRLHGVLLVAQGLSAHQVGPVILATVRARCSIGCNVLIRTG